MDSLLRTFATLVSYPGPDYRTALEELRTVLSGDGVPAEARTNGERFLEGVHGFSPGELEEQYTRTFDINPLASLEVGWHLYGEAYERGAFLVAMRERLRQNGIGETGELPDHLVHALLLVAVAGREEADEFVRIALAPAMAKMLEGLAGKDTPYEFLLKALSLILTQKHLHGEPHHA